MFIQVRRPVPELSNQSMTVFVDQRRLLHIGWIAGSQVHRTIGNARATRSFEDHGVDVRLEDLSPVPRSIASTIVDPSATHARRYASVASANVWSCGVKVMLTLPSANTGTPDGAEGLPPQPATTPQIATHTST